MPHRFTLLESLESLAEGHLLGEPEAPSSGVVLAGAPNACHVFELLRREGWIEPAGREGSITWWRITPAGRDAYAEGRRWLGSLSPLQRLLGPMGLVALPPGGAEAGGTSECRSAERPG